MIPFVGGSYELRRKKADAQRAINLFPTRVESGSGKSPMYLASVPGLLVFSQEPPVCLVPVVSFTSTCVPFLVGLTDSGVLMVLSWTVTGADTVSISGIGAVAVTGTTTVSIGDYTLTATNACGPTIVTTPNLGHWQNSVSYPGLPVFPSSTPESVAQQVGQYVCTVLFSFGGLNTVSFDPASPAPNRQRNYSLLCNNNRVEGPLIMYTACNP